MKLDPKTVFWPYRNPKNSPLGPPKVKNDSKIKSKLNARIEKKPKENESCSTTWVDPKTVFELYPNPKNSPLGPKKSKMAPKLSQNQMSEGKETKEMKVVQLHE